MNNFSTQEIDFINLDKLDAPKYKQSTERLDPFDLDVLAFKITNQVYSKHLQSNILNLQQACQDALYTCQEWFNQDRQQAIQNKKEKNRLRQQRFQEKKRNSNLELLSAKNNLQKAISNKKAAIEQWDNYISQLRQIYNELKLKAENA